MRNDHNSSIPASTALETLEEILCSGLNDHPNKQSISFRKLCNALSEIGHDIQLQLNCVNKLLEFLRDKQGHVMWHFEQDVVLSALIANHCDTEFIIKNAMDFERALTQACANLLRLQTPPPSSTNKKKKKYQHQETVDRITGKGLSSTTLFSDQFQDYFSKGFRHFYGCGVIGGVDLSQNARASKKSRTIPEINLPTAASVNLCNTILQNGKSSKGKIGKIIFTAKTDFRKYDFSRTDLNDTLLTYAGEDGTEITFSMKDFVRLMEAEYYDLRGGREENIKNDFFKSLPGEPGKRGMAILKHVQALKNRFNFGRSRRTLDAFNNVTKRLIDQKKITSAAKQAITSTKKTEEQAFQALSQRFERGKVAVEFIDARRKLQEEVDCSLEKIRNAESEQMALQKKLPTPVSDVYKHFPFFDFLDQHGELCADKIIAQQTIFRDAVFQIKDIILERRHALIITAEKILFNALSEPITHKNRHTILANCIFLDALANNAPRKKAETVLANSFGSLEQIVRAYYFMHTVDPTVAEIYKEKAKDNINCCLFFSEIDENTVRTSYLFLKSIDAQSAESYVAIAEKLILDNKDRRVSAFHFLKLVDEKKAEALVNAQKETLKRFSSFYDFMGKDPETDDTSRARREDNKKRVIFSYQFLKAIGERDTIKAYNNKLRTLFRSVINYSVLKSCRECDDTRRQIGYLDHNTPEELFLISQEISDAERYKEKSAQRRDSHSSARLFTMPRKEKSASAEYDAFCAKKWLDIPLRKLLKAGCFSRDDRIVRDDLLFESAKIAASIAEQNAVDALSEKQIFAAELLKRGKFDIANDVLQACRIVSPDLVIYSAVTDAMHFLLVQAFEEARDILSHTGVACKMLQDFNASVLSQEAGSTKADLKIFSESLSDSIAVSKILTRMMPLLSDPTRQIACEDLRALKHYVPNQHLSWIGHKIAPHSLPRVEDPAKKLMLGRLSEIFNHAEPLHLFQLNRSNRFADFLRAVYQVPAIYDRVSEACCEILQYPKIQWAVQNDTLLEKSYAEMPMNAKAYTRDTFMYSTEKTTPHQGQIVNVNYVKYLYALELQDEIKKFKAAVLYNPEKIPAFFSRSIELLQEILKTLSRIGEEKNISGYFQDFYSRVSRVLNNVIAIEQKWYAEMSMTIAGFPSPPERPPVTAAATATASAVTSESFDRF